MGHEHRVIDLTQLLHKLLDVLGLLGELTLVVQMLILATTTTVEGEATAHYISELASERGIPTSRIAHGVPLGGELEYVDGGTLAHAFAGRRGLDKY